MKKNLISLQDVLVDGEARRLDEVLVDEWMDDLKHLFYDLEDILDDVKRLWKGQVRADDLESFSDYIKDRFEKILDRVKKLGKKVTKLELKRGKYKSKQASSTLDTRATSSMVDTSEIIHGRNEEKEVIVKRLLEVDDKGKKNYDVVGIWGMGGLGKTTLAQLVYNDPVIDHEHFEVRRWVCISDVFDVSRAMKGLIADDSASDAGSLEGPHQCLQKIIQNNFFFFVLDDVWPSPKWKEKWDKIKVPFNSCQKGSKILVTTRDCNVAQTLGDEKPYQLKGLPHEQCVSLFKDKAFGNGDVDELEKEMLMICGEEIVKACKGVPLAIRVIGSMLQRAKEEKWRAVSEKTDLWDMNDLKDGIHPAIRLSYHYLPASLKLCFEYLLIFPPDFTFGQDDVVRLWIADGLVEEEEGRRVEDIGNEYYNELKARSLIQDNHRMHDIVQHLATVLSRKFCYRENSKEPPERTVRHAYLVDRNTRHYGFLAQAPCLRTLIVERHKDENVLRNKILSWKMLRTLRIFHVGEVSIGHFTHLRCLHFDGLLDSLSMLDNLKFLVLNYKDVENFPDRMNYLSNLRSLTLRLFPMSSLPESIYALTQLQVLKLTNCKLKELPEDIGNLCSLETLDLEGTSISRFPESISSLCRLQYLWCNNYSLKELPNYIGKLRSLQTLVLKGSSMSTLLESIGSLCQLQDLNLSYCRSLKELPKEIGNLRSLRTLHLEGTSILRVPESITNVTRLQNLLVSKSNQLPLHVGKLEGLERLADVYHVEKEEGRRLGELKLMNSLKGHLTIASMENVGFVEEAKMANLKSKKFIQRLEFRWSQPGNDGEMEVNIMEALQPHHSLESLTFFNYGRNKFPAWMMAGNICFSNLTWLQMEGLNNICEMIDMEFVSLPTLWVEECPKLKKVQMATPKLNVFYMNNCGELEADSVHLRPSPSRGS